MALHILLHGTSHIRRHSGYTRKDRIRVHGCTLGEGNGARFSHTSLSQTPQRWIGKNLADILIGSGGAQRERRQEYQLAPHQCGLIVDEAAGKTHLLKLIERAAKQSAAGGSNIQPRKWRPMHNMPRAHPLSLARNRRRNHAAIAVLGAKQGHVIDSIEQRDNGFHRVRIFERSECCLQLRGLHRKPEHIHGGHFRGHGDIGRELAERTFQTKLSGIVGECLAPDHHRDGGSSMGQARADQASNAAGPENRMSYWC